jgi:error-prone DNA polymerase
VAAFAELAARSNFSFLDGASHPEELAETAQALGLAGLGICDTNSLAGVVRGHVAAKVKGLPFLVGCRLRLDDGSEWLAWPGSRAAYGRLTTLLSRGRMHAAKGECRISRAAMLAAADGWALAAIPPAGADATWAARLRRDATALRDRLALPLFLAVAVGLGKTCQKLGITFWDYLGARLGVPGITAVPRLADLIRCRGQPA